MADAQALQQHIVASSGSSVSTQALYCGQLGTTPLGSSTVPCTRHSFRRLPTRSEHAGWRTGHTLQQPPHQHVYTSSGLTASTHALHCGRTGGAGGQVDNARSSAGTRRGIAVRRGSNPVGRVHGGAGATGRTTGESACPSQHCTDHPRGVPSGGGRDGPWADSEAGGGGGRVVDGSTCSLVWERRTTCWVTMRVPDPNILVARSPLPEGPRSPCDGLQ